MAWHRRWLQDTNHSMCWASNEIVLAVSSRFESEEVGETFLLQFHLQGCIWALLGNSLDC